MYIFWQCNIIWLCPEFMFLKALRSIIKTESKGAYNFQCLEFAKVCGPVSLFASYKLFVLCTVSPPIFPLFCVFPPLSEVYLSTFRPDILFYISFSFPRMVNYIKSQKKTSKEPVSVLVKLLPTILTNYLPPLIQPWGYGSGQQRKSFA